jgi:transposase
VRIYLAAGATDLRLGFDGLTGRVRDVLGRDVLSGAIFLFCNARKNRVRAVYFDGTGLWLMTKRLEKGTFAWPVTDAATRSVVLRAEELSMLLGGLHVEVKRRPGFERR